MNATDAYLIVCRDAAGAVEKRTQFLKEHLLYVASIEPRYRLAGVILAEDQESVVGSAAIVQARDPSDARRLMMDDPYYPAGVWAQIEVMPYLVAFGNFEPRPLQYTTRIPGYDTPDAPQ